MNKHEHGHGTVGTGCTHASAGGASAPTLKDPVCAMAVTAQLAHQLLHNGHPYYFCSHGCKSKFVSDPSRYIQASGEHHAASHIHKPVVAGVIYTCPMHPEIRQDQPGTCPKCGMALEPLLPEVEEEENPELRDFFRRFWWTLPLTVIVTASAMFGHRLHWVDEATQRWMEMLLSLLVVLWAGWPFFVRGWQSVLNRSPNMWTLIGLGTGAAFIYSVVATVAPQVFPASFVSSGYVAVYFLKRRLSSSR